MAPRLRRSQDHVRQLQNLLDHDRPSLKMIAMRRVKMIAMRRVAMLMLLVSCGEVTATAHDAAPDADVCHDKQTFVPTGQVQTFVPSSCVFFRTITIEVAGAQGGGSMLNNQLGGRGAFNKGDFTIAEGTVLLVLVGKPGGSAGPVGGGGGGSFVWDAAAPAQPYVVAGGGGGAGLSTVGSPGLATQNGGNGCAATAGGGANGSGGIAPTPRTNWAAGGAGWVSDGAAAGGSLAEPCGLAVGGKTPGNGGAGGAAGGSPVAASGGFGGGGGGQGQCNGTGGGGGGGYSGGGGGIDNGAQNFTCGGGGGSYNAGHNVTTTEGGNADPAGSVTISW
jgi:hypothetical protein